MPSWSRRHLKNIHVSFWLVSAIEYKGRTLVFWQCFVVLVLAPAAVGMLKKMREVSRTHGSRFQELHSCFTTIIIHFCIAIISIIRIILNINIVILMDVSSPCLGNVMKAARDPLSRNIHVIL